MGAKGSKGDKGDNGDKGDKGDKGDAGQNGTCYPECTVATSFHVKSGVLCIGKTCINEVQLSTLLSLQSNAVKYDHQFVLQSMEPCTQNQPYVVNGCGEQQSFGSPVIMSGDGPGGNHVNDHLWKITRYPEGE